MSKLEGGKIAPPDLKEARQELLQAKDRDEAVDVVLRFASYHFDYAATFAIVGGEVVGHDAIGSSSRGVHRRAVKRVSVKPPWGSMFWSVMDTGAHFLGPGPKLEFDRLILSDIGREVPRGVILVPVAIRGRAVMFLYADNGARELSEEGVVDLVTLCAALPAIFEGLIRARKDSKRSEIDTEKAALRAKIVDALGDADLQPMPVDDLLPSPWPGMEPRPAGEPDPVETEPRAKVAVAEPSCDDAMGAAAIDALASEDPDVIVGRLIACGTPDPALLVALAGHGEEGARALGARFPGSTRARVNSFATMERDPFAHGPIVAAMAFLGPAASAELLRLCDSSDPEARLYAVFLFGLCPDARALPLLVEMLSDADPRVATAARSAIAAHRGLPGYLTALGEIRSELGRRNDPVRLCDVLRALSHLADAASVPRIVDLLDHDDSEVVAEAETALVFITKESFGENKKKWKKWFDKNRRTPRVAWLVKGLSHKAAEVRESALVELSDMAGESFGFDPHDARSEREPAVEKWTKWLEERLGR